MDENALEEAVEEEVRRSRRVGGVRDEGVEENACAEGEEERIEEGMALGDDDDPQDGAMRWDRERWEARVKELVEGPRLVVPPTAGASVALCSCVLRSATMN